MPTASTGVQIGAQGDAEMILVDVIERLLLFVMGADAVMRDMQRLAHIGGDAGLGGGDLVGGEGQRRRSQRQPVEALGVVDDGGVAARLHIGKDAGDDAADFLGDFALGIEQRVEIGGEAGIAADRDVKPSEGVLGLLLGGPGGAEIGEAGFQHLDVEADGAAAGKGEIDVARGRLGFGEADGRAVRACLRARTDRSPRPWPP